MELVIFWVLLSVVVWVLANSRGRTGFGWFMISLLFSPLIGALLVLALPNKRQDPQAPTPETHVRCPDCRELVRKDARKCKHCGTGLVPQ